MMSFLTGIFADSSFRPKRPSSTVTSEGPVSSLYALRGRNKSKLPVMFVLSIIDPPPRPFQRPNQLGGVATMRITAIICSR